MKNLSSAEALKVVKSLTFDRKVSAANLKKAAKLLFRSRTLAARFERRPTAATLALRDRATAKLNAFLNTL